MIFQILWWLGLNAQGYDKLGFDLIHGVHVDECVCVEGNTIAMGLLSLFSLFVKWGFILHYLNAIHWWKVWTLIDFFFFSTQL